MTSQHFTGIHQQVLPGDVVLTTVSGRRPGPVLALLGGVHGDEDEGVLAVLRTIREVATAPLSGTLLAVAPANPGAWAASSRLNPLDGGNLARSFPGVPGQGPTDTVAAALTEHVISVAHALIDLHSAGLRYRMPLMSGFCQGGPESSRSQQLAEAFGAPVIWAHPRTAPGRSLSAAAEHGVPAIYAECSGGGSIRSRELDAYVSGVRSVMAALAMLPSEYAHAGGFQTRVSGSGDLDQGAQAPGHGLFVSSVRAGAVVTRDTEIGRLYGYDGDLLRIITAPGDGMVMFLRRQARTQQGDVLYVMAAVDTDNQVVTSRPEEAAQ
ncbi:succinylglutamate desuccinylase/aspartoacylase family protein [Phytoactinopolyspora mesophila]|uniref:Succinylglutamate desuccinylase/Aspartoacylase catalytic domain-containing protein n=1 Tax=Phytoactinopolyspora mesophila TaxID=2650750 RepID=A0A7K3LY92_9ACTN|nr:M14 family metallopeptidase [Phytoactinopolyspora mesophila]NDL55995.1 hypothetical protein [Phytoactinopolyspora mesophila]